MINDKNKRRFLPSAACLAMAFGVIGAANAGAIQTTTKDGTAVNWNIYPTRADVYLNGGAQNLNASGLADGTYYFQVTDPSGKTLLSTDDAVCRQLLVAGGRVAGSTGGPCKHANGTLDPANGVLPVQLSPFNKTPNIGGVNKAWVIPVGNASVGSDGKTLSFSNKYAKTDNFKVAETVVPPVGSCQPSSSLSVLASGANVAAYVPKGSWSGGSTGVSVVTVEGSNTLPTTNPIATASTVNSCASNSVTGQTVCTANNNEVYKISGLAAVPTVTTLMSSGGGTIDFSGGSCTNCGVAMDAVNNKAVIGLSIPDVASGVSVGGGFQFLNLATNTFEPAFLTQAPPGGTFAPISEDPLIDPIRNLLLNATENNQYELINVAITTTPTFFENPIPSSGEADSSGADCQTGIYLAPYEFTDDVFIANVSSTAAPIFTAGVPAGTWTAPSQVQTLTEAGLSAGNSGLAVAQGSLHQGVVTGEFGGDRLTAIQLPTVLDTSATTPAISDWVSCNIGSGFSMGLDPHTVTAYQSPNAPNHAMALIANFGATQLALVDLTKMLDPTIVPRTSGVGLGHGCLAGPLPATVVSLISVP